LEIAYDLTRPFPITQQIMSAIAFHQVYHISGDYVILFSERLYSSV